MALRRLFGRSPAPGPIADSIPAPLGTNCAHGCPACPHMPGSLADDDSPSTLLPLSGRAIDGEALELNFIAVGDGDAFDGQDLDALDMDYDAPDLD